MKTRRNKRSLGLEQLTCGACPENDSQFFLYIDKNGTVFALCTFCGAIKFQSATPPNALPLNEAPPIAEADDVASR